MTSLAERLTSQTHVLKEGQVDKRGNGRSGRVSEDAIADSETLRGGRTVVDDFLEDLERWRSGEVLVVADLTIVR